MSLASVREKIDEIDGKIIRLIAERQRLAADMAHLKFREGIPIRDPGQRERVLERAFDRAVEAMVDPVSVQKVFDLLVQMSEDRQQECMGDGNLP
ncbi:MAG: chorismate mutase [Methanomicrobiales archaeon]|nr:chorismate mutase [Methanomicrobiales archaeon]MDD1669123.1 chorismate mutase [Methanomicrobiales archaeon]